jgi:CHRD domain
MTGTATVPASVLRKIKAGGAYVNVHTAKNKAGEIRGQLQTA